MDIFRATSKVTVARVGNTVIGFVALAYFARRIGAGEMGVYFLFLALVEILSLPADFGIAGAMEKRISEGDTPGAYVSTAFLLKLVPVAVVAVPVVVFREAVNGYVGGELAAFLVVGIALNLYSEAASKVLRGEKRVGATAVPELTRSLVWVVVGVVLVRSGLEARALVYGLLAGYVAKLLVAWARWRTPLGRPGLDRVRSLWNYSKYNFVTSANAFSRNWVDVVVIGFFMPQGAVGAYEIAWRVAEALLLVTRSFAATLLPLVSAWGADREWERIASFVPVAIVVSVLFVVPGLFGALALSSDLLGVGFGPEFAAAALALVILAGGKCFEAAQIVASRTIHGVDRPDVAARIALIAIATNVVVNVALVPVFGLAGAAVGTAGSTLLGTVLLYYRLSSLVEVRIPVRSLGYVVAASTVMWAVVAGVRRWAGIETLPELVGVVALGGVVYLGLVYAIRPLRRTVLDGIREAS